MLESVKVIVYVCRKIRGFELLASHNALEFRVVGAVLGGVDVGVEPPVLGVVAQIIQGTVGYVLGVVVE